MLHTIILEDEAFHAGFLKQLVVNRIMVNPSPQAYDMKVELVTSQASEVLAYVTAHPTAPLLLLTDIELAQQAPTGIDVAAQIRQLAQQATIVFISSYPDYLPLTITRQIEPLDFIYKGTTPEELEAKVRQVIDVAYARYLKYQQAAPATIFTYEPVKGVFRQLDLNQICYIQSVKNAKRLLKIVGPNLQVEYHAELAKVDHAPFVRVARDTVVNPAKIDHFDAHRRLIAFDEAETLTCLCSVRKVTMVRELLAKPGPSF